MSKVFFRIKTFQRLSTIDAGTDRRSKRLASGFDQQSDRRSKEFLIVYDESSEALYCVFTFVSDMQMFL